MKPGIRHIVGKTIAHVVVKQSERHPRTQLFLVFTDGTSFEVSSPDGTITSASGRDQGGLEAVQRYMAESHRIVQIYPPPEA